MLSRFGKEGLDALNALLIAFAIDIGPLSETHRHTAADEFRRYGKGRHPAAINFGDCFSYALAKTTGLPLLFKGQNFSQTDLIVAA